MPKRYRGPSYFLHPGLNLGDAQPEDFDAINRTPGQVPSANESLGNAFNFPQQATTQPVSQPSAAPAQPTSLNLGSPAQNAAPQEPPQGGLNLQGPEQYSPAPGPETPEDAMKARAVPKEGGFNWGNVLMALGAAAEAGSAGLGHRPSQHAHILQAYLGNQRQKEELAQKQKLQEAEIEKMHAETDKFHMEEGRKLIEDMPQLQEGGEAGKAVFKYRLDQIEKRDPGSSKVYQQAWDDPNFAQSALGAMDIATHGDPVAQQELKAATAGMGRKERQEFFRKEASNPEFQKRIIQRNVDSMLAKMGSAEEQLKANEEKWTSHATGKMKYNEYLDFATNEAKDPNGNPLFTAAEIHAMRSKEGMEAIDQAGYEIPEVTKRIKEEAGKRAADDAAKFSDALKTVTKDPNATWDKATPAQREQARNHEAARAPAIRLELQQGAIGKGYVKPEHADLHGEDYLKTLPPGYNNEVKATAEYKLDPARVANMRGNQREALMQHALQVNPDFDMRMYGSQRDVMNSFMSKKEKDSRIAIDQSINHMGTLMEAVKGLNNKDLVSVNRLINYAKTQLGHPEVNSYEAAQQAVGEELMRVFRQVNASEREAKEWEGKFSSSFNEATVKAAVKRGVELLGGRANALNNIWNSAMGTETGYPHLISPQAEEVLARNGFKLGGSVERYKQETQVGPTGHTAAEIEAEKARRRGLKVQP